MSAGSSVGHKNRRAVYINSMKFYDNEVEIEGEKEQLKEFSLENMRSFTGTAEDLLHTGNHAGALLLDDQRARDAYNDKMLKYNSKFAQLVGKLRSNTDKIEEIVMELPHLELIDSIRKDIFGLDSTTQSFNRHFMDLKSKI